MSLHFTPIYIFLDVKIDVTKSASSRLTPCKAFRRTFLDMLSSSNTIDSEVTILDLGAGNLRNTIYFLQRGCSVVAVDYEKIYRQTIGHKMLKKAKKYDNFIGVFDPDYFFNHFNNDYDIIFNFVLLINVLNKIPLPWERESIVKYLRYEKCLKGEGGVLVINWHTRRKIKKYSPKLYDGVVVGKKKYKTFYTDFYNDRMCEMEELRYIENNSVINLFIRNEFELSRKFDYSKNDDMFLFHKT